MKTHALVLLLAPCVFSLVVSNVKIDDDSATVHHPILPPINATYNRTSLTRLGDTDSYEQSYETSGIGRPRVATLTDEQWENLLLGEGCTLIGMMATPDSVAARFLRPVYTHETAASVFTDMQSFQDWGYTTETGLDAAVSLGLGPDLDAPLRAFNVDLRLTSDGGTTSVTGWRHDRQTTHGHVEYAPTRAHFRTLLDVDQGVIIAGAKFGPKHMGSQQNPPVTILPRLKNWADVVLLDWQRIAGERHQSLGYLRYIFSSDVENSSTKDVIRRILNESLDGNTCHRYLWDKRVQFIPHDEGYKALLASPNGRGAALLLITHKSAFGQRRMIGSITVWCAHTGGQINMVFNVKDQEEVEGDSDWDEDGEPDDAGAPIRSVGPRAPNAGAGAGGVVNHKMQTPTRRHVTRVRYV